VLAERGCGRRVGGRQTLRAVFVRLRPDPLSALRATAWRSYRPSARLSSMPLPPPPVSIAPLIGFGPLSGLFWFSFSACVPTLRAHPRGCQLVSSRSHLGLQTCLRARRSGHTHLDAAWRNKRFSPRGRKGRRFLDGTGGTSCQMYPPPRRTFWFGSARGVLLCFSARATPCGAPPAILARWWTYLLHRRYLSCPRLINLLYRSCALSLLPRLPPLSLKFSPTAPFFHTLLSPHYIACCCAFCFAELVAAYLW